MIERDLEAELAAEREPVRAPAGPDPSALLAHLAQSTPAAPALVADRPARRVLTWLELSEEVDAVASGLVAADLLAGQRLVVSAGNSAEFVVLILAALRAGVVVVPLDPGLEDDELRRQVVASGARVAICDPGVASVLARILPELSVRPLDRAGLRELANSNEADAVTPADPEALAVLLSTSGTSADPVAAMMSRRALAAHLDQLIRLRVADATSIHAATIPLWTAMGLVVAIGGWLASGGTLVVPQSQARLADLVVRERVTHLPATPLVIFRLLRARSDAEELDLGQVRLVLSGGGALPAELEAEFTRRSGLRIEQGYGLTECAGVASTLGGDAARGRGHVGRPLPGVEVRIGDGSEPAEPAEIFIKGAALFSGYWPDGRGAPGQDGWFATGDLGYLDGDELFWVDRVREAVVVNGFSVYPAEVEHALAELTGVAGVAVLGAPRSDDPERQEIVAFVMLEPGAALTEDDVLEHGRSRLARFKQPRRVVLLDRLPRVTSGTVSKAALRRLLAPS